MISSVFEPDRVERGKVKHSILIASCAMTLALASAVQARSLDDSIEALDGHAWSCFLAVAGSEQDQGETSENEQKSEEEPDCE